MTNLVSNHLDNSLNYVKRIYSKAIAHLEALAVGEKLAATKLAETVANEMNAEDQNDNLDGPNLYPVLRFLYKDYPNFVCLRGKHGGLKRLHLSTDANQDLVLESQETTSEVQQ